MDTRYIQRSLELVVKVAVTEFPAIVLTGPRQAGKTTLLKHLFGQEFRYVCLDLPDVRAFATQDPRSFMAQYPPPVIFDEIQYAPDLLHYVKVRIDENRSQSGQYILAASQNLLLNEKITETLAGRAAILRLLPMSRRELEGRPLEPFFWESDREMSPQSTYTFEALWAGFLRGGYPEAAIRPDLDVSLWHANHIQAFLERDLRMLRQVGDLVQFQNFL